MEIALIGHLALAFALGLLIGLQREYAASRLAGIRTFTLIAAFGGLCAVFLDREGGAWVVAAGLLAVAAMFWIGNRMKMEAGEFDLGVTTEIAGLVTFIVGAMAVGGYAPAAVVTAGIVAVLLHWKQPLHQIVERLGEDDVNALVRLVIIGMVILPVMPNQAYGPYGVINPFEIWLMVVLIVGISMAAYVAHRLMGEKVGTLLAGLLGGLISSTATTVSYARRTRGQKAHRSEANVAAIVIMLASTIVFGRVLFEIVIVAPGIVGRVVPPLVAMMAFMLLVSGGVFWWSRSTLGAPEQEGPPSDLKAAVVFGLLYAAVLFGIAAAKEHFGDTALYAVAALSGLTDMDAITLSTAQLMKTESLEIATGWRLILVGAMANLVFKAGVVAVLGTPRLLGRIAVLFSLSLLAGIAIVLFWPG